MSARSLGLRGLAGRALSIAICCATLLGVTRAEIGVAAPAPSKSGRAGARAGLAAPLPEASLGEFAGVLEGTWEFQKLSRKDGLVLAPPAASGVIVIDRGALLVASFVQASPERKIGQLWEGRMVVEGSRFRLIPENGYRYDSAAEYKVAMELPTATAGTIERTLDRLILRKDDGGTVTYLLGTSRRIQEDADGTIIEHLRTSITPRVPENLPGRAPAPARRRP